MDDRFCAGVIAAVEGHGHHSSDGSVGLNVGILEVQTVVVAGAEDAVELAHDHLCVVKGGDLRDLAFGPAEDLVQLLLHPVHGVDLCHGGLDQQVCFGGLGSDVLQISLQGLIEEQIIAYTDENDHQKNQEEAVTSRESAISHFPRHLSPE